MLLVTLRVIGRIVMNKILNMKRCFRLGYYLLWLLIFLSSCGDDVYDETLNGMENEVTNDVSKKISQNVSVYVTYSNYSWNISINTSLKSVYPYKTVKYGILCGYNGEPYYYTKYFALNGNSFNCIESLFIDGTGSPYGMQYLYWKSLIALQEKGVLSSSENDLKNEILNDFRISEPEAKALYWGQVFVEADGQKYIVREFGNKRHEDNSN